MTALNTTDDLLKAARENAEFREAFRREILTDALIAVPDQLRELTAVTTNLAATGEALIEHADVTNQRLGSIDERIAELVKNSEAAVKRMDSIDTRMDGIDERIAELVKGMADYKTGTENHLVSIGNDIKSLHRMYSRQHDDYERFRGSYSENSARKDDGVIAAKIARARGSRVLITERLSREDMTAIFKEAVERDLLDGIDDESQERFANADDALLVTERGRAATQFYMVIEASHTANRNDLSRAANHAKVIERVKGIPAYGVVAGTRIGQNMPNDLLLHDPVTFVQEKDPDFALWHQLRREVMDPMTEPQ